MSKYKWIPVADQVPSDSSEVVCLSRNKVYLGNYYAEKNAWYLAGDFWFIVTTSVTHWMPLPPSPFDNDK